jgi:hypothetical protein
MLDGEQVPMAERMGIPDRAISMAAITPVGLVYHDRAEGLKWTYEARIWMECVFWALAAVILNP